MVPEIVIRRAREIAMKIQPYIAGRKTKTVAAACLKLALDELMPDKAKSLLSHICSILKAPELSVKNFIEILKASGILKDRKGTHQ